MQLIAVKCNKVQRVQRSEFREVQCSEGNCGEVQDSAGKCRKVKLSAKSAVKCSEVQENA